MSYGVHCRCCLSDLNRAPHQMRYAHLRKNLVVGSDCIEQFERVKVKAVVVS